MSDIPNWASALIGLIPTAGLVLIVWGKRSSDVDAITKAITDAQRDHDDLDTKVNSHKAAHDSLERDFIRHSSTMVEQHKQMIQTQRDMREAINNLTRQMGNVATMAGSRIIEIPSSRGVPDDKDTA